MPDDVIDLVGEPTEVSAERDALDQVWLFVRGREMKAEGDRAERAFRPAIDAFFHDQPIGTELFDGEHGVGLRIDKGPAHRWLDFEATPEDLLLFAAQQGWLSLNIGAMDGGLKSSDPRIQHYAQQLAQHVRSGESTRLTTIRKGSA